MLEVNHLVSVLEATKKALNEKDSLALKELSNQHIHCATLDQGPGDILTTVIVYTLSKLVERRDYEKMKQWNNFEIKFNGFIDLAIKALKENNEKAFTEHITRIRNSLMGISGNLKPYIEEVIRKASINKASKIYEHGISLGQTAQILGITPWELSEYSGQRGDDFGFNISIDVKKRIKTAMEFFS
ncbi:MAG: hypothetical protein AABX11_05600 [Nanoarchaeota archaeon]